MKDVEPGGKVTRSKRDFQVFVKPAGGRCNLECRYCYYLEKAGLAGDGPGAGVMPPDLLERYIVQHFRAAAGTSVTFSWHGGEPTLLGLDYFRRIVALQRAHRPKGVSVLNGIQTNGILVDEEWARFFADERFHVGLSLDGPADVHDRNRVNRGGGPTHSRVMRAFEVLKRFHVPVDVLAVVTSANVDDPLRFYRFFKKIGVRSLTLLPAVRPRQSLPVAAPPPGAALLAGTGTSGSGDAQDGSPGEAAVRGAGSIARGSTGVEVTLETVPAEAYGRFLCTIFDEWVAGDSARIAVQLFDEATRPARGLEHSLCIFRRTCGDVPVLESTGDVYSCDHFVDADHLVGNIAVTELVEIVESPAQRRFGQAKWDQLPRQCRECDVLPMCNGGCPKDRLVRAADGEAGLNYLCPAYKMFFTHVLPYAVKLACEDPARRSLVRMMEESRKIAPLPAPGVGRNDPCPCGSGRKYKKCCLRS